MTRYVIKIEKIDDETGKTETILDSAAENESYTGYEFIGENKEGFRICGGGMSPCSLAQVQAISIIQLLKTREGGSDVQNKD